MPNVALEDGPIKMPLTLQRRLKKRNSHYCNKLQRSVRYGHEVNMELALAASQAVIRFRRIEGSWNGWFLKY